ncbi:MAG: hypothetical protein COA78_07120 [Blastopirellula sp.]|nr:MAG: hypothetical protein COA78_07120 [Blastopirellula sp.]
MAKDKKVDAATEGTDTADAKSSGKITLPNGIARADFIRDNYYGESDVTVSKCDPELKGSRSLVLKAVNTMLKEAGQPEIPYQIVYAATKKQDVVDPRITSAAKAVERAAKKVEDAAAAKVIADKAADEAAAASTADAK